MKQIIYQAMARLWGNGHFSAWNNKTFAYLSSLGVGYLWLTGIPRHASGKSFVKGNPGCPYSVTDWKDVNPYMADNEEERVHEFELLVRRAHRNGIKILTDFIPNHVACDYHGEMKQYGYCDGDWTDTLKNDWSAPETFDAALDALRFWASLGVDGFRCDMVELVPQEPQKRLISEIKKEFPGTLFVAEVYDKSNYRSFVEYVGFDLLYDKSGMYDSLISIGKGSCTAESLTWNWQFLSDLQPRMLNFLENHDELRIASRFCLGSAERAYPLLAASMLFNDASFMLYFGQELGEDASESDNGRTSIFSWTKPRAIVDLNAYVNGRHILDERESAVLDRYRRWLELAQKPVFRKGKCWDLCYCNKGHEGFDVTSHFCFLRFDSRQAWLVFCNFSDREVHTGVWIPEEVPVCGGREVVVSVPSRDAVIVKVK